MRYYVSVNFRQDEQLKELENAHEQAAQQSDDFQQLVREFVGAHREGQAAKKPYIPALFDSINRIIFTFQGFKEARSQSLGANESIIYQEETMILSFFENALAFLELIQKNTSIKIDRDLFQDVKKIRNYLVHFYEKEIEGRRFLVELSIERGMGDLSTLEVRNIDTYDLEHEIRISLDLFYFALKDIFGQLKDNIKRLK